MALSHGLALVCHANAQSDGVRSLHWPCCGPLIGVSVDFSPLVWFLASWSAVPSQFGSYPYYDSDCDTPDRLAASTWNGHVLQGWLPGVFVWCSGRAWDLLIVNGFLSRSMMERSDRTRTRGNASSSSRHVLEASNLPDRDGGVTQNANDRWILSTPS